MRTAEYFDERSSRWTDLYDGDPRFARRYKKIVELIDRNLPGTGTRALDAGCGSGVFSRTLAARGFHVLAFDASSEMIVEAKRHSSDNIEYWNSGIESMTIETAGFDLVLSLSMLEYVDDADAAITRLCSALKMNGILIVSVPNARGLLRIFERGIYRMRRISRDRWFKGRGEYLKFQKHQWPSARLDKAMARRGMIKQQGIYLNSGFDLPNWAQIILEDGWWAGMYCAAYRKS